jgi:hypothetical protein
MIIENRKYHLLTDRHISIKHPITKQNITLSQIEAARDITDQEGKIIVHEGELGGYIASEHNLSQEGSCWVDINSRVADQAKIYENAYIKYSTVFGNAQIYGNAFLNESGASGDAQIYGNAIVTDSSVYDTAHVFGETILRAYTEVYGDVKLGVGTYYADTHNNNNKITTLQAAANALKASCEFATYPLALSALEEAIRTSGRNIKSLPLKKVSIPCIPLMGVPHAYTIQANGNIDIGGNCGSISSSGIGGVSVTVAKQPEGVTITYGGTIDEKQREKS